MKYLITYSYSYFILIYVNISYIFTYDEVIPVYYEIPHKHWDGIQTVIPVFDIETQTYKQFTMLVDTLSYITWIPSSQLNIHNSYHQQLKPFHLYGHSNIKFLSGEISGNYYITNINLTNYIITMQPILLINNITINEYISATFDGVLGLSKYQQLLSIKNSNISLVENILIQNKSPFIIMKLGGVFPYIKFGEISDKDVSYIKIISSNKFNSFQYKSHKQLNINDFKEQIIWINLYEEGIFALTLYNVVFVYRDNKGKAVKREVIVKECEEYGCKAMLDTKSYFIYGPYYEVKKFDVLKREYCDEKELNKLPDIEFGFVDVNVNRNVKLSNRIVKLILEPRDYMVDNNNNGNDENVSDNDGGCFPGVVPLDVEYGWNFGVLLLSKFLIAYDIEKDRIGFVRIEQDS